MKSLDLVITEESVSELSTKVLKSSISKITEELQGAFCKEVEGWVHEHYLNSKSKIESNLITEITEEFIANPMEYKYSKLRKQLFLENKEQLTSVLNDEAIHLSVENVIEKYTHRDYCFNWRWNDAIAEIILNNANKFLENDRVNNKLLREIENLKRALADSNHKISELNEIIDERNK